MAGLSTASNGAAELSDNDGGEESRFELTSILDPAIADPTASPASAAAVRSTESYDSNLYVGTSDGNLLWYTLSNEGSSTQPPTYRLNSTTTISAASKPVEKIVLLQAISVAVVLCESIVTFYELPTFQPIPPSVLPHIKAVATVVQDDAELESGTDTDGLVSLCIIKRKQIILAKLGKERWVHVKEVSLPGGASIARRYREQLCIATTSAYSLVNLADSTILPLGLPISQTTDSPSAQVRPSILSIVPQPASLHSAAGNRRANSSLHRREGTQDGCEFLITSHSENMTLGVFVKSNGEPAPKLIEWPSHPRALVLDRTRVFALLRNDTVEVHDVTTMEKLTTLSVPASLDPRFLAASPSLPSAWLCGKNAVHRVGELPLIRRASRLVGRRDWEGLKELADEAWEHESREEIDVARQRKAVRKAQTRDLQRINQELGFYFLENINFALARRYLSRGRLDPRIVIRLFTDVRRHVLDDDDEDDSRPKGGIQGGMQDEPRAWKTVEDLIRANLEQNYCPPLDVGSDPVLQRLADALLARAKFDLLRGFLVDCRQQRRGEQREGRLGMDELTWRRIGMVIDIVLAKVYAAVGDLDELLAVLNEPGNESLEGEVERALRNSGQYGMLAGLLLKKGDQGGAMETVTELLARQEDPAVREQINLLLDSHSIQLDLPTTIRDLSDEWLLSSSGLQTFLRRRVRQQLHTRQEVQIVRALSLAQNLEVAEKVWGTISQKQKVRREGGGGGGGGGGKGPPAIEDVGKVSVAGEGRDVVEEQSLGKEGKAGGGGRRRGENGRVSIADFGSLSKESPTSVRT